MTFVVKILNKIVLGKAQLSKLLSQLTLFVSLPRGFFFADGFSVILILRLFIVNADWLAIWKPRTDNDPDNTKGDHKETKNLPCCESQTEGLIIVRLTEIFNDEAEHAVTQEIKPDQKSLEWLSVSEEPDY